MRIPPVLLVDVIIEACAAAWQSMDTQKLDWRRCAYMASRLVSLVFGAACLHSRLVLIATMTDGFSRTRRASHNQNTF